jgi:class 3 adenylate cyclase
MVTYVSDRVDGFIEKEISDLVRVSQRLSLLADLRNQRRIASNILTAYLASNAGPKVLAGQIRQGTGEEITAVLWSSDLRGFTERSDRLAGIQVIAMLNALFDAQAKAIVGHGGEILIAQSIVSSVWLHTARTTQAPVERRRIRKWSLPAHASPLSLPPIRHGEVSQGTILA